MVESSDDCGYCVWEWNGSEWELTEDGVHCNDGCTCESPNISKASIGAFVGDQSSFPCKKIE